jgi:hypothetical protein
MEGYKNTNQNLEKESLEKFGKEEDFEFLTEEELTELTDDERADYNRKLEKKGESDQIEHHNKVPEVNQERLYKKWEKKVNKLYKKDPKEPYWNK